MAVLRSVLESKLCVLSLGAASILVRMTKNYITSLACQNERCTSRYEQSGRDLSLQSISKCLYCCKECHALRLVCPNYNVHVYYVAYLKLISRCSCMLQTNALPAVHCSSCVCVSVGSSHNIVLRVISASSVVAVLADRGLLLPLDCLQRLKIVPLCFHDFFKLHDASYLLPLASDDVENLSLPRPS